MEQAEISKAILGDAHAVEALVEQYYAAIYAFCCRRMGSVELGADCTQDTFIKMVEGLPRYKDKGRFQSWLYTIAANTCRDTFRRQKPTTELDETLCDPAANGFEQTAENRELLRAALLALPDEQAEAVILHYYHDMPTKEIARIMGVPPATAKTRLHRGVKKLKTILGEAVLLET